MNAPTLRPYQRAGLDALRCFRCGATATLDTKARRDSYARSGRTFCSPSCRDATTSEESAARMAATNRRHASARMRRRNPMRLVSARAKMAATLRSLKHGPVVRRGNGKPTPAPQAMLAKALGWPLEVIVATGLRGKTPERYPTHYKLDIAHPDLRIAVEVDGSSHAARRHLDAKKDRFLRSRGWTVLRFTNAQVLWDVDAVAWTVRQVMP